MGHVADRLDPRLPFLIVHPPHPDTQEAQVPIIMGGATVPSGTTATALFTIPPSYCNVTFYNLSVATVWVGTSTAVTSANGLQCHSIPTNFQTFMGSKGATLYGTTGSTVSTSVATVQYVIVTDF